VPIYGFRGYLLPQHRKLTIPVDIHLPWGDETGLWSNITVKIVDSQVDIACETKRLVTAEEEMQLRFRSLDTARWMVGCASFITGLGVTVVLTKMIKPGGIEFPLDFENPNLASRVTAFTLDPASYTEMVTSISDLRMVFAMNDLIESITTPHVGVVNCCRAVEGIRLMMTPQGAGKKQGWETMRQNLNIDQSYLVFITEQSEGPRHADRSGVKSPEYTMTLERSWTIMNRYLEFTKRGSKPLLAPDFPLLK
jgi:hypothetical protein